MPHASIPVLAVLALAPSAAAQISLYDLAPPAPPSAANGRFGGLVAPVGDVDGDGHDDLAIAGGAPGVVRVTSGRTDEPIYTVRPTFTSFEKLSLDGAGDLNADGFPDFLVGAPYDDQGGTDAGRVWAYDGRLGAFHRSFVGSAGEELGFGVSGVGDADADGFGEVVIGAPGAIGFFVLEGGQARVYAGVDGSLSMALPGLQAGARMGEAVDGVGDFDGDGLVDLVAGAPGANRVSVATCATGAVIWGWFESHGRFGARVAGGGDVDGDGLQDVVVAAPLFDYLDIFAGIDLTNSGRVLALGIDSDGFFRGPLFEVFGDADEQRLGGRIAIVEDVDGDGRDDVAIGGLGVGKLVRSQGGAYQVLDVLVAPAAHEVVVADAGDLDDDGDRELAYGLPDATVDGAAKAGEVRLYAPSAPLGYLHALRARDHGRFGHAIDTLGDLDGDGLAEWIVGAPYDDVGGSESGAARVYRGSTGTLLRQVAGALGDQVGAAVAGVGDLDADGVEDYCVGAPRETFLGAPAGFVRAYSGASGAVLWTAIGLGVGSRFGHALDAAGDVNGDGVPDVVVGAPWYGSASTPRRGRAVALSGIDGAQLFAFDGPSSHDLAGWSVAGAGDVDGDGRAEIVVGAPGYTSVFPLRWGRVDLFDPPFATPKWTRYGAHFGAEYGAAVAGIGDVDGDGRGDVAFGAPFDGTSGEGRVWVVRGHDGAGLHEVGGTTFSLGLGTSLAGVGDADNDGVPDYAAGAPRAKHPLTLQTIGRVEVRSGAGGGVLRSSTGERVGGAVGGGDDVDGDGLPDVAAGGPDLDGAGLVDHGFARVLSSRAAGTTHFGAGTPGCAGPQLLTAADVAAVGATFELRCSGVAPNTFGTLLASTGSNPVGVDVGFGALIHVDLFGVFLLEALPSPSGSHGSFAVPIPNDPGLAGFTFHAQEGFLWAPGCAAIPLGLSSSNGLSVTIQP